GYGARRTTTNIAETDGVSTKFLKPGEGRVSIFGGSVGGMPTSSWACSSVPRACGHAHEDVGMPPRRRFVRVQPEKKIKLGHDRRSSHLGGRPAGRDACPGRRTQ